MNYAQHESNEALVLTPERSAQASVIWLHGLGADGFDFAPIVPELRLPAAAAVRFIFPHAALRPVTINNGFVMRAWYDIAGVGPQSQEDEPGIREAGERAARLIDAEQAHGVAPERVVLAGFSQGGAVALHAGLRHQQRLAGVLALSTYLPLRARLASEAAACNRGAPILFCHGLRDQIVPAALGEASCAVLRALGYAVEWRSYSMEHQVCAEEIQDIGAWLTQTLALR